MGILEVEADGAKIQTVRINAEVFCGLYVAISRSPLGGVGGGLVFHSIDLLMAVAEVEGFLRFLGLQTGGVFELMPSPIGHGCQGHTCPIFKRERLQSCNIDSRGEVSVADRERGERIGLGNDRIVTSHDGLPVDGSRRVLCIIT